MNLLLIDGHSLSVRAYFAAKMDEDGGLKLFKRWVSELLLDFEPLDTICAWDTKTGSTFRKKIHPTYKGNRGKSTFTPEYIDGCMSISEEKGLINLAFDNYEADDVIAKVCLDNHEQSIDIISGDKDLLQLVSEYVMVHNPLSGVKSMKSWTPDMVKEEFGIHSTQFSEYKALIGDLSDNYKGVIGIGPVAAKKLLNKYETIDNIYKNIDEIEPNISTKLKDGRDDCYKCKDIAAYFVKGLPDLNLKQIKKSQG